MEEFMENLSKQTPSEKRGKKKLNQTKKVDCALDPENDDADTTLNKLCQIVLNLQSEIANIREELATKVEFTAHNSLELRLGTVESSLEDLQNVVENL